MEKLEQLKTNFIEILDNSRDPVICWSGGKDSTFLLLLAKSLNYNVPALMFSSLWSKKQKEFIATIISEYKITAFFYRPDELRYEAPYLIARYPLGGLQVPVIFDHYQDDSRCGTDIGKRALVGPRPLYMWTDTITGAKKSDTHPLIPDLNFSTFSPPDTKIHLPLWSWTDQELLEATRKMGIPVNEKAYSDDEYETGNFTACMNCVTVGEVYCPKVDGMVAGIGV